MASRRAAMVLVTVAVLAAGAWWLTRPSSGQPSQQPVQISTATVIRTDLSSTTQLSGVLGYPGNYQITAGLAGTVTALPQPGQVVQRGQPLFEINGAPDYLFYGARPEWRALSVGVAPGADIAQLAANLSALHEGVGVLPISSSFTWATAAALERWQQQTAQSVTGRLDPGTVVYAPGPVRVASPSVALGATVSPGAAVLVGTSPIATVSVSVPTQQAYLVHAGDAVTVTLPDGRTVAGHVTSISDVAVAGSDSGGGPSGGPNPGPSGAPSASVPATVAVANPQAVAHLDQAPVTVNVTDRVARHVLAVPITALVSLAGGGYGVWDQDPQRHLVAVTPGLFATSLVQVTSGELHVGDRVEVPRP